MLATPPPAPHLSGIARQIYNVSGGLITEDVLQHMHMFTKFGEMAHDKQESGAIKPFQKIMFLVRDWGSPKNHAFGAAGGDEYFNKVLSTSADDAPQELKEVRRDLRKAFSDLECYLMPRPGDGIAEGEDDAEITPRFNAHLNTLVPSILKSENLVVKEMLGREVTCSDLIEHIKAYSTVFSSGKLPEISSVFDATAELNHERLVMAANDSYAKSMDSYAGVKAPYREPETLEMKHKEAMAKAIAYYAEAPRLSHARIEAKCSAELKTKVDYKYTEICASNESKALLTVLKTPITFGGEPPPATLLFAVCEQVCWGADVALTRTVALICRVGAGVQHRGDVPVAVRAQLDRDAAFIPHLVRLAHVRVLGVQHEHWQFRRRHRRNRPVRQGGLRHGDADRADLHGGGRHAAAREKGQLGHPLGGHICV